LNLLIEFFIYFLLLIFVIYRTGFWEYFMNNSIWLKLALFVLFGFLITGQLLKKDTMMYPFHHWGMYSQVYPNPFYSEFIIQINHDSTFHYPFNSVTSFSPRALMRHAENQILLKSDFDEENDFVSGLINIYEFLKPEDRITKFSIYRVNSLMTDNSNTDLPSRKILIYEYAPPAE